MYQIKITRPGSLESVLVDREITPNQVTIITAILEEAVTYGEVLGFLNRRRVEDFDAPVGAGESVEAYRG